MTSNVTPSPFGTFSLPFPWSTPAVDALICALDARNVGIPEIVRRVKEQFPTLANSAIPFTAVEKRLLVLDQNVELDYFKHGLGLDSRTVDTGVGESRGIRHGLAIHHDAGEEWERVGVLKTKHKPSKDSLRSPTPRRGGLHPSLGSSRSSDRRLSCV